MNHSHGIRLIWVKCFLILRLFLRCSKKLTWWYYFFHLSLLFPLFSHCGKFHSTNSSALFSHSQSFLPFKRIHIPYHLPWPFETWSFLIRLLIIHLIYKGLLLWNFFSFDLVIGILEVLTRAQIRKIVLQINFRYILSGRPLLLTLYPILCSINNELERGRLTTALTPVSTVSIKHGKWKDRNQHHI